MGREGLGGFFGLMGCSLFPTDTECASIHISFPRHLQMHRLPLPPLPFPSWYNSPSPLSKGTIPFREVGHSTVTSPSLRFPPMVSYAQDWVMIRTLSWPAKSPSQYAVTSPGCLVWVPSTPTSSSPSLRRSGKLLKASNSRQSQISTCHSDYLFHRTCKDLRCAICRNTACFGG